MLECVRTCFKDLEQNRELQLDENLIHEDNFYYYTLNHRVSKRRYVLTLEMF